MTETAERLISDFTGNYMGKLFYFCLKKTGNTLEAEDLAQDIAWQILSALNRGTVPEHFPAWVWQIARRRYCHWADEKHRKAALDAGMDICEYEIADESEDPAQTVIRAERLALLRRELAFIRQDYREIVVAYYLQDQSVREIAGRLSLSEGAVKQRLYRARNILKEGMDMAREFGVRSYKPEEMTFVNMCVKPGERGQPWTLTDPKLHQNIFLSCCGNPMTAEELSLELGVAMPYMEDTLQHLCRQGVLLQNDGKVETAFPILSRATQWKIHLCCEEHMPSLTARIAENIDRLTAQFREAGLCFWGEFQSYGEAKWTLLLIFYQDLYRCCPHSPTRSLGDTHRPDGGQWDLVGFEKADIPVGQVGMHSQTNGFTHYRIEYAGLWNKTPANLTETETAALLSMAEGEEIGDHLTADALVRYGYAEKCGDGYRPRVTILRGSIERRFMEFCEKGEFSADFREHARVRKVLLEEIFAEMGELNRRLRTILAEEIPVSVRRREGALEALIGTWNQSRVLGYLLKYALADGWLQEDDTASPALGAWITIP